MSKLAPSELILNNDGSVYHIHLKKEHIAPTVLLVGDQGRVKEISSQFDVIEHEIRNREFVTHTGSYKGKRLTAISTGIGTDNIDIVVNELDAAVNIDPTTREFNKERRSLDLIRIGTSGAIQPDIEIGTFLLSTYSLGLDGLIYYYHDPLNEEETKMTRLIRRHLNLPAELPAPNIIGASPELIDMLSEGTRPGITVTAAGFYGPQGRQLSLEPVLKNLHDDLRSFHYGDHRITNFEMESSALYGLGQLLGHRCATCCAIIANRANNQFADDYKPIVRDLIRMVLDRLADV